MSVKFYLKSFKKSEDKTGEKQPERGVEVFARICYKGAKPFKYSSFELDKIKPSHWDRRNQRANGKLKTASEFNYRLSDIKTRIEKVRMRYINENDCAPSVAIFKTLLDKEFNKNPETTQHEKNLKTFWGYFDNLIERCKTGTRTNLRTGKPLSTGTIGNLEILHLHLKRFEQVKKFRIDFDTVDLKFFNAFVDYSVKEGVAQRVKKNGKQTKGGGHSASTTAKLVTHLKVVLREADEEGYSKNSIYNNRRFSFTQKEPSTAIYLTEEEVKQVEELDLSGNRRLERVRDLFVVACHTGVRFIDLPQIAFENLKEGCFEIIQQKTGKPASIPMKIEVENVLRKYEGRLPAGISNQKFDEYIKEVCALAPLLQNTVTKKGIKEGKRLSETHKKYELVSAHTGRRTFASNEYNRGELTVREIMSATGHETEKAFFGYIRTTQKEHSQNALRKIKEREAKRLSPVAYLKAI